MERRGARARGRARVRVRPSEWSDEEPERGDERGSERDRQNVDVAEPLEPALDRVRADVLDDRRLIRAVAAGRRRGERPAFRRAELRWVDLSGGRRLQVVTYDDLSGRDELERIVTAPGR